MTQDVQPLTWQKRTNLEEHQQFFSKINEIIDNLAPTVDEAEAAIAQATAAIASANDAIATANAASVAASAAASQAQTAASTVAGYDARLTAAEGDIDALQAADQTMAGNITALGTRMTAAESKNSQQDTAIGALQTADGQNVKINRINEYAVGLTGNQLNISGYKGFLNSVELLKRNTFNALGWTNIFNVTTNNVYVFVMVAGQSIIICHMTDRKYARIVVIGAANRPYTDCVKVAHNMQTDEYEVWFNAAYGSWARGYMINEGSGNGVGSPANYIVKNIRGNEPAVGEVYDTVDTCVRWNVVA